MSSAGSALALRRIPDANVSWGEEAIVAYEDVDIAIAVATPNGLITPIIVGADTKTLSVIATEMVRGVGSLCAQINLPGTKAV